MLNLHLALKMDGEYNIVFDDGEHLYTKLVNEFVKRLRKRTEEWGFTCIEDHTGMSYFDQLEEMKKNTKATVVIFLPNHDERRSIHRHKAQNTLHNAIEETVPMIPIALENAKPSHFKLYPKLEFKTKTDWEDQDLWRKLHNALGRYCGKETIDGMRETKSDADSSSASPQHDFISDIFISELASDIVSDWWKLAIRLGLQSNNVEEIENNKQGDVCAMGREMLFSWRSKSDEDTDDNEAEQTSMLCQALRMVGKTTLAEKVESKYNGLEQLSPLKKTPVNLEKSIANEVFLLELAGKFGKNWEEFGLLLDIKNHVLQTIKHDFQNDTHRRSFQTLVRWRESFDGCDDDKMKTLIKILQDKKRMDLVEWIKDADSKSASTVTDLTNNDVTTESNLCDGVRQLHLSSDMTTLDEACSKYGRTSPKIKAECKRICDNLKSNGIKDVWPAYAYPTSDAESQYRIIFIVITENNDTSFDDKGYRCLIRQSSTISEECKAENTDIRKAEKDVIENADDDVSNIDDIMSKIEDETGELLHKHTNLNRISASKMKSTGYRTGTPSMKKEKSVVLYVHVKGYIPLDENPFPDKIGDYPVDVREGIVSLVNVL